MASLVFSLLAFSLLFISVSVHGFRDVAAPFSYGGRNGPLAWGNLSTQYATCSCGKLQSPVDIVKSKAVLGKNLQPLIRRYVPVNATLINNGISIRVQFEGHAGDISIDGKNYTFKQMHWHSPSEHRIDGHQFAAEHHLVHQSSDGHYAVVAILYHYGPPDPLIAKFEDKLPELAKKLAGAGSEEPEIAVGTLDASELRKKSRKYFRYVGSLTTPPCSENIIWSILGKVRTISKAQVEALRAPLAAGCKNNARPPQPLNGRQIQIYEELMLMGR